MLKILTVAALLLGAPAAFSQTVSSCPTATAGSVWAKGAWLPCSTTVAYIAQPVATTALVSDMRCPIAPATGACVFSWQLGSKVLPSDGVWVKDTAFPNGTWVRASTLNFSSAPNAYAQCTTFLYTGALFTLITTTGQNSAAVTSPVTGTITLAAPLPLNGTTTFAAPPTISLTTPAGVVSWDFSSESPQLNSTGNATYLLATFTFTTSNGVIVSWKFNVVSDDHFAQDSDGIASITSTVNGDTVEESIVGEVILIPPSSITGSSNRPGTWTCQMSFTTAGQP